MVDGTIVLFDETVDDRGGIVLAWVIEYSEMEALQMLSRHH